MISRKIMMKIWCGNFEKRFLGCLQCDVPVLPPHECFAIYIYLTVILRGRAGYELIYITNEAVGRAGYYQLISGKSEKNNCFSKFSSNSLDFFGRNLLNSWRLENIFSDLQNFSTRNSPSVFPYLVKLNDNGSYHGLREPIRKAGKSLSWAKNLLHIYEFFKKMKLHSSKRHVQFQLFENLTCAN